MRNLLILFFLFPVVLLSAQDRLTPEKLWQLERLSDPQVSPDGSMILYGTTHYNLLENHGIRNLYLISSDGGDPLKITSLEVSAQNARWRPDGQKIGFLAKIGDHQQLWEVDPNGSNLQQVTFYDFDIQNFAYAPDGKHISFTTDVKLDQNLQDRYPDLPKANARIIDDLMYRHWDQWHNYSYSHLFYDGYQNGSVLNEPIDIMKDEKFDTPLKPFGGSGQISWSPDGKQLLYVCKKYRGKEYATGTDSDLYLYDINSGKTSNLTDGLEGYDTDPVFSHDGSKIAWLNMERPGFEADRNVIHIYDLTTGQVKPITKSLDQSASHLVWSHDDQSIYFIAGIDATYQVFQADLKTNNFDKIRERSTDIQQITQGWHNYYDIQWAGNELVGSKTTMSMPLQIFSIDPRTGQEVQLSFVNQELLDQLELGQVKKRLVTTSDQKEMLVWMIFPPDFDPDKKYPTLLYCQGGPQSAVSQFFSYRWNFQLMAAQDYIIVAPNRRGLPSFGQEWNDDISGDWGGQAMKDYLAAIDDVALEPYVDQDRLGAVGASYGGYSIYYLAGIHEGRFKSFISHCGVFNLESWYGSTEEIFFANWEMEGPYWLRPEPESYARFSPHKFVRNWDTPILVIHGQKDFRVPVSQGIEAFSAAQLQDIPSRFLYFPEEGHWVLSPQNGVLWHRVFFDWLGRYL